MVKRFRDFSRQHRLLTEGDRLLVAVSGGPDSIALLRLLMEVRAEWRLELVVVHLNHELRGVESRQDSRWVKTLSARLGFPCIVGRRQARAWARRGKISLEEAARRARLDFFQKVSVKTGIRKIALGHQADDQAETVLMRLLRGTGPEGLGGIRPGMEIGSLFLIRPLLPFWRNEVISYLDEIGWKYRQDRSNRDRRIFRNRVRWDLLPFLERNYNSRIKEILFNLAQREADRDKFIKGLGAGVWSRLTSVQGSSVRIELKQLRKHPVVLQEEILKKVLARAGCPDVDRHNWSELTRLLRGGTGREIHLPHEVVAKKEYDRLILFPRKKVRQKKAFLYPLSLPGEAVVREAGLRITTRYLPSPPPRELLPQLDLKAYWLRFPFLEECKAYFFRSRLNPPLLLRSRRPGDRFRPLGLKGTKKVKDILIDEKIPTSLREMIPLLEDGGGIIWMVGGPPHRKFRLRGEEKKVVEVSVAPLTGSERYAGGCGCITFEA